VTSPPLVLFGYNARGEEVKVPLNHTGISGINNSGKTEAAKALARRFAEASVKMLILDDKTIQPDYRGFGDAEIPVYIERITAPETIQLLLEQTEDRDFSREFHRILKAFRLLPVKDRSMAAILGTMTRWANEYEQWEKDYASGDAKSGQRPVHPLDNKADTVVIYFLEKLVKQIEKIGPVDTFGLPGNINVMDLTGLDRFYQQLPVQSMLGYVEKHRPELGDNYLAIMIDEFTRFAPMAGKAAAKQKMIYAIKEFRAGKTYFIAMDQTLSGVHIQIRKQFWNWIMGHQRDTAESERVMKELPEELRNVPGAPITADMVKRLTTGWFVVWTEHGADVAFAAPWWAPLPESRRVAMGEMTAKELADKYQSHATVMSAHKVAEKMGHGLPDHFEERVKLLDEALNRMGV